MLCDSVFIIITWQGDPETKRFFEEENQYAHEEIYGAAENRGVWSPECVSRSPRAVHTDSWRMNP